MIDLDPKPVNVAAKAELMTTGGGGHRCAEVLQTVNVTWADTELGHGPVGTAIRTREPAVFKDVAWDPNFAHRRAEALKRGYASVVGVPLVSGTGVLRALAIYASEPGAFDDEEVGLLRELADDLIRP